MSEIRLTEPRKAVKESPRLSLDPEVRALQERINRLAAGLGDETMAAVLPALADVRRELAREMADWLRRHPQDGAERWTFQKHASLMLQLRETIKAIKAIEPAMFDGLKTTGRTAGEMSARQLEEQVRVYSRVHGQPILLDLDTAAILARGRHLLIPHYENSAKHYTDEMQAMISGQLARGWLKGESWDQLAARIARAGAGPGDPVTEGPAGIARGLWRMSMHSAYRIARTEGMNALNLHQQLGLQQWAREEPGAQKRWDASQDMACARCRALHNVTIAVREQFALGVLHPTLHPYCRCCVKPHHIDWS